MIQPPRPVEVLSLYERRAELLGRRYDVQLHGQRMDVMISGYDDRCVRIVPVKVGIRFLNNSLTWEDFALLMRTARDA